MWAYYNLEGIKMQKNEYDVKVIKVVDGDTVDVDIDLGFGVTPVSYTHLTLPRSTLCRSRWSPYH